MSAGDYIRPYLVPAESGLRVRYADPFRALLRRHSRLYATLERHVLAFGAERGIAWLKPGAPPVALAERLRWGRAPREDFEIFRRRHDPGDRWEEAWNTTFALLRAFRDECDALGARLLVVVIPSVFQVERTAKRIGLDVATRMAGGRPLDRLLDWNLPERRLAGFFEQEGIEARFLLAPLREAAESEPPVYGRDEHLGPRGHEIAARSVVAWLMDEAGEHEFAEISGEPARILPGPSEAHALLDFREQSHALYLGDGWLSWAAEEPGTAGGWLPGSRALVVLSARGGGGDFVVRGWVPSEAPLPIDGHVEIVGGPRRTFRLEQGGAFEFRFPWSPPRGAAGPSADRYLAAFFVGGVTQRVGEIRAGPVVQQIGLEMPSGDAGEPK